MLRFIAVLALLLTTHIDIHAQSTSLFDGKSLAGWKVSDPKYAGLWRVEDGLIVGGSATEKIPVNSYLLTEKKYKNFEFRCLFKLEGDPATGMINSGVQYRSELKDNNMIGYQADIGDGYWGDIYDEHRRGKLVSGNLAALMELLRNTGWNSYIVRCTGDRHELYINGIKTADYIEKDKSLPNSGVLAFQIHSGGKAQIFLKNLEIETLPD